MMDELKYIFENFGSQTTTLVIAFMVFKTSLYGFITYGINQSIKALVKLFGSDVSKSDFERNKLEQQKLIAEMQRQIDEKQREVERVLHMYKMLKEGKVDGDKA